MQSCRSKTWRRGGDRSEARTSTADIAATGKAHGSAAAHQDELHTAAERLAERAGELWNRAGYWLSDLTADALAAGNVLFLALAKGCRLAEEHVLAWGGPRRATPREKRAQTAASDERQAL